MHYYSTLYVTAEAFKNLEKIAQERGKELALANLRVQPDEILSVSVECIEIEDCGECAFNYFAIFKVELPNCYRRFRVYCDPISGNI